MARYRAGHTTVLAGHGFDEAGPYLLLNDVDAGMQERFFVRGRTFSLIRLARRRCIGRFDLRTLRKSACPLGVELLPDAKEPMCPACAEATGFNPSFYHADFISPQQRAYNQTPHFAYLAYFSPQHVKAGISSQARGIERLLEQGARTACVAGRFPDADKARALEAALVAQPGIMETMRASLKARLLADERYDSHEAVRMLDGIAARLGEVPSVGRAGFAPEPARDLSSRYFGGPSPESESLQIPEGHEGECGGRCIGMVGGLLVFEQGGANYVVSLKSWESHEVRLLDGEVACEYEYAPQQFSLF